MKQKIVTIEKIVTKGLGFARWNGKPVFVEHVLPGEKIRFSTIRETKKLIQGRVLRLLKPSPHRVDPDCPYFYRCINCHWQFTNYHHQLEMKVSVLKDALRIYAKINNPPLYEIRRSSKPWHYKNKIVLTIRKFRGLLGMGYFMPSSNKIVDVEYCPIALENLSNLILPIKKLLSKEPVSVYNEVSRYGKLRYLVLRGSEFTGEVFILFVTKDWGISKELAKKIEKIAPEKIVGVAENVNPRTGKRLFGSVSRKVIGNPYYIERIGDYVFRISTISPLPENTPMISTLIDDIHGLIRGNYKRIVIAHAGVGVFPISLADLSQVVIAMESLDEAYHDAIDNISRNDVPHVEYQHGKAADLLPGIGKSELLFLSPQRKQLADGTLHAITLIKPPEILYFSEDPISFAKDIYKLLHLGYDLKVIIPYDFHPQTYYVDTLAYLHKE